MDKEKQAVDEVTSEKIQSYVFPDEQWEKMALLITIFADANSS